MSQAPEIAVSKHNIITERNNVSVSEKEKERWSKGEEERKAKNEGGRITAHKNNVNQQSWELGGAMLEKVAEVERAVGEKA